MNSGPKKRVSHTIVRSMVDCHGFVCLRTVITRLGLVDELVGRVCDHHQFPLKNCDFQGLVNLPGGNDDMNACQSY